MKEFRMTALLLIVFAAVAVPVAEGGSGGERRAATSCGDSEGGGVATRIRAAGVGCREARAIASLYTGSRAGVCASDGSCRIRGFRCAAVEGNDNDTRTKVLCSKRDGKQSIRFLIRRI